MHLKNVIGQKLLLFLIIIGIITSSSSCTKKVVRPVFNAGIQAEDVLDTPVGVEIIIPANSKLIDKDGKILKEYKEETKYKLNKQGVWFSDFYVEKVIKGSIN